MKKLIIALAITIFVVACSTKYTEINDQGFGGGFSRSHSSLNHSFLAKNQNEKDEAIAQSELLNTNAENQFGEKRTSAKNLGEMDLVDSVVLNNTILGFNDNKKSPNKIVTKLNKVFLPFVPKSLKGKFLKKIESKSSIFGYEGYNFGMTLGCNLFFYGLFVGLFCIIYIIISLAKNGLFHQQSNFDLFIGFLFWLSLVSIIGGGLLYLISLIVSKV